LSRRHFRYHRGLQCQAHSRHPTVDCRRHIPRAYFLLLYSFRHIDGSVFSNLAQKNVYTVFRSNPPAVGFAQLSSAAGGSSGSQRFFSHCYHLFLGWDTCHGSLIRSIACVPSCGRSVVTINTSCVKHAHSSFRDLGSPSTTVGPAKATSGSSPGGSCECSLLSFTVSC
jgi:hypothetical protein